MVTTAEVAILAHYTAAAARRTAIAPHLPRLRALATGCAVVVEFGVKDGASSAALLLGADQVVSYDLVRTPAALTLAALAGGRWEYRIEDSRRAPVTPCDLLFVDSLHTYAQTRAELERHADAVRQTIAFHDTITFGSVGADGESGHPQWTVTPGHPVPIQCLGIRPAIDELMMRDRSWAIAAHYVDSHGLLVLERR